MDQETFTSTKVDVTEFGYTSIDKFINLQGSASKKVTKPLYSFQGLRNATREMMALDSGGDEDPDAQALLYGALKMETWIHMDFLDEEDRKTVTDIFLRAHGKRIWRKYSRSGATKKSFSGQKNMLATRTIET
jgi:hypothetical protein